MTPHPSAIALIQAWHDAVNAGDAARLTGLTHPEVEFAGPRGSGTGIALVREWVDRAGIHLEPRRWFHRNDTVVVEQIARWRDPDSGAIGPSHTLATAFRLHDSLVARIARHDTLAAALAAAGLPNTDEMLDRTTIERQISDAT